MLAGLAIGKLLAVRGNDFLLNLHRHRNLPAAAPSPPWARLSTRPKRKWPFLSGTVFYFEFDALFIFPVIGRRWDFRSRNLVCGPRLRFTIRVRWSVRLRATNGSAHHCDDGETGARAVDCSARVFHCRAEAWKIKITIPWSFCFSFSPRSSILTVRRTRRSHRNSSRSASSALPPRFFLSAPASQETHSEKSAGVRLRKAFCSGSRRLAFSLFHSHRLDLPQRNVLIAPRPRTD